jgi:DNA primase
MGLIPEEIITQVLDRCDIVELIGSYVPLKKAGRNFKANCPFHNEKTPSFVVNPDKQIFHCFGCDAGGNVIGFVMKQDRLTFPEAIRVLANKVNVAVPESSGGGDTQGTNIRQSIYKVNALAAQFFHAQLLSDKGATAKKARAYLKNRKIDLQTVEQFQLGLAPDQWDGLILYLREKRINLSLMEKAGLIIPRDNAKGYYDRFRNRIMFPIFDTQANCRAFGARAIDPDKGQVKGSAKYINSPETNVYTKGHHLYGFHLAKQTIIHEDSVIIVEGYMDCIMPYQAGVTNIVAALGTALTVDQIRLLRRYTKNVVMLFDMDPAGESAMLRSLDTLTEEGIEVKVAVLSESHDPDSFICEYGVEAFREQIRKADTLFNYKLGNLIERYDVKAIEGKARISGEMLQTIDKFSNAVLRAGYVKRLASELSVPEQALTAELNKVRQMTGEKRVFGKSSSPKTSVSEQLRVVESDILRLLLEEKSFIEATKKEINPSDFQDKKIREVISKIFDLCEQGIEVNSAVLINSFEDQEMQNMISRLMANETLTVGDKRKMHSDYMNRMKKDRKKLRMKILQEQIGEAEREGDQSKLDTLLKEYNHLIKEVTL